MQGSWRNRLFWTDLPSKPWKTSKFSVLKRVFREKSRYPADFELKIHFVSIKIFSFWGRMKNPREVFQAWEGSEASNSKTGDSSGQTAVQHFTWLFLVSLHVLQRRRRYWKLKAKSLKLKALRFEVVVHHFWTRFITWSWFPCIGSLFSYFAHNNVSGGDLRPVLNCEIDAGTH